jgi:hypothetical protein
VSKVEPNQLLYLVFGGELTTPDAVDFGDLSKFGIAGIYPDYKSALKHFSF